MKNPFNFDLKKKWKGAAPLPAGALLVIQKPGRALRPFSQRNPKFQKAPR
jgi:hypothetical protein